MGAVCWKAAGKFLSHSIKLLSVQEDCGISGVMRLVSTVVWDFITPAQTEICDQLLEEKCMECYGGGRRCVPLNANGSVRT